MQEKKDVVAPVSIQNVLFKGIFFGIFFILIVFLFFSYPRIVSNFTISDNTRELYNKARTMAIKDTIVNPISTFYLLNGRYPDDLDELSASGYLENAKPGWESLFDYTPSLQDYTLTSR